MLHAMLYPVGALVTAFMFFRSAMRGERVAWLGAGAAVHSGENAADNRASHVITLTPGSGAGCAGQLRPQLVDVHVDGAVVGTQRRAPDRRVQLLGPVPGGRGLEGLDQHAEQQQRLAQVGRAEEGTAPGPGRPLAAPGAVARRRSWPVRAAAPVVAGELEGAVHLATGFIPDPAVLEGRAENDSFNQLLVGVGLKPRDVVLFRAWFRYLRQTGLSYSMITVVE